MWGSKGKKEKDNCPSTPPSNSLFILAETFLGVIAIGDASAAEARWVVTLPKILFTYIPTFCNIFAMIGNFSNNIKFLIRNSVCD